MQQLLVATHNPGKVREYRDLLADLPLQLFSLDEAGIAEDLEETGDTFEANAVLKAEGYARLSGMWTWADDSGLEVDALDGAPGIYSARFGGPGLSDADRMSYLLGQLRERGDSSENGKRTARFRCVVALALPPGPVQTTEGVLEGEIVTTPQGTYGFGYDPIFFVPALGMTLAQAAPDVKNRISHRAQAAQAAKELLLDHTGRRQQ